RAVHRARRGRGGAPRRPARRAPRAAHVPRLDARPSPGRALRDRPSSARRMSYLRDVAALARKDLLLELRARDTLPAMLLFVVATFVVFHFALPGSPSRLAASGLLW